MNLTQIIANINHPRHEPTFAMNPSTFSKKKKLFQEEEIVEHEWLSHDNVTAHINR